MITLVQQYFTESAKRFPNKLAIFCDGDSLTFSEVDQFSNAYARAMPKFGVGRGDFVLFFMKKSLNSILSILNILKA